MSSGCAKVNNFGIRRTGEGKSTGQMGKIQEFIKKKKPQSKQYEFTERKKGYNYRHYAKIS